MAAWNGFTAISLSVSIQRPLSVGAPPTLPAAAAALPAAAAAAAAALLPEALAR